MFEMGGRGGRPVDAHDGPARPVVARGAAQIPLASGAQVSNILLIKMARFQALTNNVLDAELEMLRKQLGLDRSQKAELLREVAGLAAWVVQQAERGREIQARDGQNVEPLVHPALERVRARKARPVGQVLALSDSEVERLAAVLSRPFNPPAGLRAALASLANPARHPPKLRWKLRWKLRSKKAAAA
jgi:hypothetical protein